MSKYVTEAHAERVYLGEAVRPQRRAVIPDRAYVRGTHATFRPESNTKRGRVRATQYGS